MTSALAATLRAAVAEVLGRTTFERLVEREARALVGRGAPPVAVVAVGKAAPAMLRGVSRAGLLPAEARRVLVVAHSTLLRLVLCALLGIDPESYRQVFPNLRNATVTTLDLADDGAAALDSYNVPIPA